MFEKCETSSGVRLHHLFNVEVVDDDSDEQVQSEERAEDDEEQIESSEVIAGPVEIYREEVNEVESSKKNGTNRYKDDKLLEKCRNVARTAIFSR